MTTLLVASTGGHLKELHRLLPRLPVPDGGDLLWVTNDTVQSRALLDGQEVVFLPYQGSRNVPATIRNAWRARDLMRSRRIESVISTGSGIALSFLPLGALRGVPAHYIESGTRISAPSVTGTALRWVPGVHCYSQHRTEVGRGWNYGGSVLEGFAVAARPGGSVRKVVVTLGTWRQSFIALVERLLAVLPPGAQTLWQTGFTDVGGLPIDPVSWLQPADLAVALREADVVVTHAGMGATLDALEAGKLPVVVPRRQSAGEQIDDHQVELARELGRLGLAITCLPQQVTCELLLTAACTEVRPVDRLAPFRLVS